MTITERQEKISEAIEAIYDILWEMEWFGDFGSRQKFLKDRIKDLKIIVEELHD
jgi:hypothetical protein